MSMDAPLQDQKIDYKEDIFVILQTLESTSYYQDKECVLRSHPQTQSTPSKGSLNHSIVYSEDLAFLRYKEIYIGGVSIDDITKRQCFGLNSYYDEYFYYGEWNNNLKEGIGFLNIPGNKMYLGEFKNNQFDGFGILYYADKGNVFCGEFKNGKIDNGNYFNSEEGLFYQGKLDKNKKNDKLCSMFELGKGHIFIGEIFNDVYIKGYLIIGSIKELEENHQKKTSFAMNKKFYFDKSGRETRFIYDMVFDGEFSEDLLNIAGNIFQSSLDLKDNYPLIKKYFEDLKLVGSNPTHNQLPEIYDPMRPKENNNIRDEFLFNFDVLKKKINRCQEKGKLSEHKDMLMNEPKTNGNFDI